MVAEAAANCHSAIAETSAEIRCGELPTVYGFREELLLVFQNLFRTPELKDKILFTLLCLLVYRIGAHVAAPGINPSVKTDAPTPIAARRSIDQ